MLSDKSTQPSNESNKEKRSGFIEIPDEIILEPILDEPIKEEDNQNLQKFESDEHIAIGDRAFEIFLEKLEKETEYFDEIYALLNLKEKNIKIFNRNTGEKEEQTVYEIPITDELSLTAGEVVALAGDFFGLPDKPISFGNNEKSGEVCDSKQEDNFMQAYQTLMDEKNRKQIDNILAYIKEQSSAHDSGESIVFKKDSSFKSNLKFSIMSDESNLPCSFRNNRYIQLALKNFDHFGKDALRAFLAGHYYAVKLAQVANNDSNFRKAIGATLFACHFLTDLYASGHIRTPRREILNAILGNTLDTFPDLRQISSIKLVIAGLLAKKMHDEDCKNGLNVRSIILDKDWQSFGDGSYFSPSNKVNAEVACETVALALLDVVHAYKGQKSEIKLMDDDYLTKYLPISDENANYMKPLYKVNEDRTEVICRETGNPLKKQSTFSTFTSFFKVKVNNTNGEQREITTEKEAEDLLDVLEEKKISCTII